MNKKITVASILLLSLVSCGRQDKSPVQPERKYEYDTNSEQYSKANDTLTENQSTIVERKEPSPDEMFEVYNYIYSNGSVTKAEVNVLFVDGKKDELQIIIDTPDGQSAEINLVNPVSLGIIKGMDSYMYTSTSDNNKEVNVYFHNGRKMMGMTLGNQSVVFMNTPSYKE